MTAANNTNGTPAVVVDNLRKEFFRNDGRHGLRRRRKRVAALDGVTFEVGRGETVAILGQNGSGKSTLIRLLSTLLLHDGGAARIFGHDAFTETRAVRRLINRVSVEASFFKKMSAVENLSYAARFYGMPIRETRKRIPEILERVGFPKARMNEPLEDLSRGMQQKVALARALLTAPIVLLLDEPTTGLDPRSKLEVQKFIREIRREHDASVLLCTHDLVEAEELADRVGILDRGRLIELATGRRAEAEARREDARGGLLRSDRQVVRGRAARGGRRLMPGAAAVLRHELIGLSGVFERNVYLVRRYIWWDVAFFVWTIANTLTIVFIGEGVEATGGNIDVQRVTTQLLVGAVVWAYLGVIFEILTETVAWERWEGTIEYTFMAPLSRPVHLFGMGLFAIVYGIIRAILLFGVVALFFDLNLSSADYLAAIVVLLVASVSFIGIGMMTAVLPLISPEKGTQLGFMAQGILLVISGVYYPVSVLPEWMQFLSVFSPATYALDGLRDAIIEGDGLSEMGDELWPLVLIGAVTIPLGLWVFRRGEIYAKRHGKLKRSG